MDFYLTLCAPLTSGTATPQFLAQVDLTRPGTSCSFTTALPGGFGALTVDLPALPLPSRQPRVGARWNLARQFAHGILTAGGQVVFEGALMQVMHTGPEPTQLVFEGYGISAVADDYYSNGDTRMFTTGVVLADALAQAAPRLVLPNNAALFGDPGIAHAPSEFVNQTVGTMLQQFAQEGDTDGNVWDWTVYENRVAQWQARVAPTVPDYLVPLDADVDWREDYHAMYGTVQTIYNLSGSSATSLTPAQPDATFPDRIGFSRTTAINGSTMTAAGANAFAAAYQSYHSTFPDYAITIKRTKQVAREEADRGLSTPGGEEIPPWMVRAGQWVQVEDQGPFIVVRTQYDTPSGALTVKLGELAADQQETFQHVRRAVQHQRKRTNVSTGAPLLG